MAVQGQSGLVSQAAERNAPLTVERLGECVVSFMQESSKSADLVYKKLEEMNQLIQFIQDQCFKNDKRICIVIDFADQLSEINMNFSQELKLQTDAQIAARDRNLVQIQDDIRNISRNIGELNPLKRQFVEQSERNNEQNIRNRQSLARIETNLRIANEKIGELEERTIVLEHDNNGFQEVKRKTNELEREIGRVKTSKTLCQTIFAPMIIFIDWIAEIVSGIKSCISSALEEFLKWCGFYGNRHGE